MATLIPPMGGRPSIVLTRDEALTVLATLDANATYGNREVRHVLTKYIERLPAPPPSPFPEGGKAA